MTLRSAVVCVTLFFGSVLGTVAGPASAGVGTQIAPTDNTSVSAYKVTDTSPGASARDSAGASASQAGGPSGTSSTGASSTDASSSNGAAASNGAASSNGSAPSTFGVGPSGAKSANETAIEMAHEKVIDTGDKAIEETDKAAKAESRDKTFAPGLLDKVSDISVVGAQKEQDSQSKTDQSKSAGSEDKNDSRK